jgi:hypothetical protein
MHALYLKNVYYCSLIASVAKWSEFLSTDPEVPGSIPGHYKKKKQNNLSGTGSTKPREHN